ncbi:phosphoribosylformimino-5-aminoimidazole carboxamide ribotide isomerase [Moritella dasanensis]|uniref:phosphoribosylformimino-5-aminoimidazole carboxamide ribotide isomerase n=1 Tax=Moritella dasanensis TaxID=428031 RepID=UPI0003011CC1|nr:phosphoribosylformimino-5-aminoimidazole carboxamide ribotide isomerase [Moritella dasanensis]
MTQFRPCIDLHQGKVKQIVGGSLNDQGAATNFISQYDAAYYANIYRQHDLRGGHVIALGPNNEAEVVKALRAWPQALQFGGGVNLTNAAKYIEAGASHVIVTSYLFDGDEFSWDKLAQLKALIGKAHLILDLSCRKTTEGWNIATNRWQTVTSTVINAETLQQLSEHCAEFLIHAADVEGLQNGIDQELVSLLGQHTSIPVTYAGGARSIDDLALVDRLSNGKVDLTIGSALDIFGGSGITLQQCIDWNKAN